MEEDGEKETDKEVGHFNIGPGDFPPGGDPVVELLAHYQRVHRLGNQACPPSSCDTISSPQNQEESCSCITSSEGTTELASSARQLVQSSSHSLHASSSPGHDGDDSTLSRLPDTASAVSALTCDISRCSHDSVVSSSAVQRQPPGDPHSGDGEELSGIREEWKRWVNSETTKLQQAAVEQGRVTKTLQDILGLVEKALSEARKQEQVLHTYTQTLPLFHVLGRAPDPQTEVTSPRKDDVTDSQTYVTSPRKDDVTDSQTYVTSPRKDDVTDSQTIVTSPRKDDVIDSQTYVTSPRKDDVIDSQTYVTSPRKDDVTDSQTIVTSPRKDDVIDSQTYVTSPRKDDVTDSQTYVTSPRKDDVTNSQTYVIRPQNDDVRMVVRMDSLERRLRDVREGHAGRVAMETLVARLSEVLPDPLSLAASCAGELHDEMDTCHQVSTQPVSPPPPSHPPDTCPSTPTIHVQAPLTHTPNTHSVQAQTPTPNSVQAHTPTTHTVQAQTPTTHTVQAQTPTTHTVQAQTPTTHTVQAQTPTAHTHTLSSHNGLQSQTSTPHILEIPTSRTHSVQTHTSLSLQAHAPHVDDLQAHSTITPTTQTHSAASQIIQPQSVNTLTDTPITPTTTPTTLAATPTPERRNTHRRPRWTGPHTSSSPPPPSRPPSPSPSSPPPSQPTPPPQSNHRTPTTTATPVFMLTPSSADDKKAPAITAIISTRNGLLLLADAENKKVKVVDLADPFAAPYYPAVELEEPPVGLGELPDGTVAVTTGTRFIHLLKNSRDRSRDHPPGGDGQGGTAAEDVPAHRIHSGVAEHRDMGHDHPSAEDVPTHRIHSGVAEHRDMVHDPPSAEDVPTHRIHSGVVHDHPSAEDVPGCLLTVETVLETHRRYHSVAGHPDGYLVVGCRRDRSGPARVDLLTRRGHLVCTVADSATLAGLDHLDYLCVTDRDPRHVLVSDSGNHTVVKVELTCGQVSETFVHKDLRYPRQVCVARAGSVYVASGDGQCVLAKRRRGGSRDGGRDRGRDGGSQWSRVLFGPLHSVSGYVWPWGLCVTDSGVVVVVWRKGLDSVVIGYRL